MKRKRPLSGGLAAPALALALAVLLPVLAPAGEREAPPAAAPDVELVQSAPVETDLAIADAPLAKDVWLAMVRGARATIDLAQFYVSSAPKSDLEPVIAELEKAAERGVKVRLLVSNKLLDGDPKTLARFRAMKGARVVVYDLGKLTGGILHAKYWVVDHREAFVGSQNFDWRALTHIHETGLHVRDRRIAEDLERIFELDLAVAESGKLPPAPVPVPVPVPATRTAASPPPALELVASPPELDPPGTRPAIDALLELLAGAKKTIRVQLLEYSPVAYREGLWTVIDDALRAAAARGVKVRLLVSHWNTAAPAIDHLKKLSVVPGVEVRIITIPEARAGFIPHARVAHSKYMVVDEDVLWVGTSNWSKGYFAASRNVELIARLPKLAAQGGRMFEKLWSSPCAAPVDPARAYPPPRKGE